MDTLLNWYLQLCAWTSVNVGLWLYILIAVVFAGVTTRRIAAYAIYYGNVQGGYHDVSNVPNDEDGEAERATLEKFKREYIQYLRDMREDYYWWAYVVEDPRVLWFLEVATTGGVLWPLAYGIAIVRWTIHAIASCLSLDKMLSNIRTIFTMRAPTKK